MKTNTGIGSEDRVSAAYERLRDLIVHGRLAPGSRIIETELAARLGVSRTPVRSALSRLQQEGLVLADDSGKNVRMSVAPLTQEDSRELLKILGCMEGLGAGWAASLEADSRRRLTGEMRALNAEMERLLAREDRSTETIFELHSRFHVLPLEFIDAPRIRAMHTSIRPQVERYRRIYVGAVPREGFAAELREHEPILQALEQGDGAAARAAVEANWAAAAERLAGLIGAVGDRGNW